MHALYAENMSALKEHHGNLEFPFPGSVFPSATYNLGPRTVTYPHLDFLNAAFGWCGITALGSFDYKRGGHLILWDLGLVIKFPPGATIFIPSAIMSLKRPKIGSLCIPYIFRFHNKSRILISKR